MKITLTLNEQARQLFAVYREELHRAFAERPAEYMGTPGVTADKMIAAMKRGSYNHDGHAFKATCKRLGIKYTRTALNEVIDVAARLDVPPSPVQAVAEAIEHAEATAAPLTEVPFSLAPQCVRTTSKNGDLF